MKITFHSEETILVNPFSLTRTVNILVVQQKQKTKNRKQKTKNKKQKTNKESNKPPSESPRRPDLSERGVKKIGPFVD